jgi:4-aminobutyrate aminotransferase-like enzyme
VKRQSQATLDLLRQFESRNVTFLEADGSWPIVWERAQGSYVWDADGRKYLDLTAAFGVAAAGHANLRVVRAGQKQMGRLLHAMGDVHPHKLKARLARELSRLTFERWTRSVRGKTIFCNSGFEAVEAALKTAILATGRREVLAFEGGYHGLGYGALNATQRAHFRQPFLRQLGGFGRFAPFPVGQGDRKSVQAAVREALSPDVGAVLIEPVQARGGIRVPPRGFLPWLRKVCSNNGSLLVLDEIYTGFGRTGRWFGCEHEEVVPDVVCLGKALTGGFPLSACVGRGEIMDAAWPPSSGEAIHTSTFLGHPVGCAMAMAQIAEIGRRGLPERAADLGQLLLEKLGKIVPSAGLKTEARGQGLLAGLEMRLPDGQPATAQSLSLIKGMLHQGFILLPEGQDANVVAFTPPLTISERELNRAVSVLNNLLDLS